MFTIGVLHFVHLDKCTAASVHQYSIIPNGFAVLKIRCAPASHPHPQLSTTTSSSRLRGFAFPEVIFLESC